MNKEELIAKAISANVDLVPNRLDLLDSYWKQLIAHYNYVKFRSSWSPVEPGWWAAILSGLDEIEALCESESARFNVMSIQFDVLQIKEKFGDLRIYSRILGTDYVITEIKLIERNMIAKCAETCIVCGEPGEARYDLNWLATLCDKHYQETLDGEVEP